LPLRKFSFGALKYFMQRKIGISFLLLVFYTVGTAQQVLPYQVNKEFTGDQGAVVSAHPLASKAGLSMLQQGGNAIDAAIATQLALAVVYPGAGNLGGGGFMLAYLNSGKTISLDYRETAPAKAFKDMFLDKEGNPIKQLSLTGPLASGTPGTVAGLFASMKYATLPFKKLIEPAIELAEKGFAITASQAQSFNSSKDDFKKVNDHAIAFIKNTEWKEGDLLIQNELAQTLKRIRSKGRKGFYNGHTARLIVKEMKKGQGIISLKDLKNYRAKERIAISYPYK